MVEKSLLLILGNQLFSIEDIKSLNPEKVFVLKSPISRLSSIVKISFILFTFIFFLY